MTGPIEVHKPKRPRSPGYPGISLREAIEKARVLHGKESRSAAPIEAIYDHWGYAPKSGAGNVAISALKKFGLIEDEGSGQKRKARLSDLGLRIVLDERVDSPEREEAIRRAALLPKIHRDIWEHFGGSLPSDANLRHFLRFERGFTENAAAELIKELHDTVAFAQLDPSDIVSPSEPELVSESGASGSVVAPPEPSTVRAGRQRAVALPLSANERVTVQAAFPLSEDAWQQMLRVLDAMKPGLVADRPGGEEADE